MIKTRYMRILRRPPQYALLASLILLSIPIFMLNMWVVQKGSVIKLVQSDRVWWIAAQAVWTLITFYWLWRVRWRGFWSFLALAALMLVGNVFFLVSTKNYALAFYALFLLILSALYAAHLYRNLREPYYESGQHWFEGEPRFLPRLEARLRFDDQSVPLKLSRLGIEGCYTYFEGTGNEAEVVSRLRRDTLSNVHLKLDELELECAVQLVSQSKDGKGRGLRFVRESADQDKDIRDFIDRVRSAGYVP